MDLVTPPPPSKSSHAWLIGFFALLIIMGLLTGGLWFWFSRQETAFRTDLDTARQQVENLNRTVTNLNAQLAANANANANANTNTVPLEEQVKRASVTCTDTDLVSSLIQYSYDDPRDYLKPFFTALNTGKSTTAEKFLKPVNSGVPVLNLARDYSGYTFSVSSWGADNKVAVQVTTITGSSQSSIFATGKDAGCWKVTSITDPTGLFR